MATSASKPACGPPPLAAGLCAPNVTESGVARQEVRLSAEQRRDARRLEAETRQNKTDDRFTSPELLWAFEDSFGEIDFDPCWHPASAVRPKRYLNVREGHNGLRDDWSGCVAFVNPPWSAQDRWVRRAHAEWSAGHVEIVLCLVPAATGAAVFHDALARDADIYFLAKRPRFSKVDGSSEPTMHNVMVVMFGTDARQRARFAELVPGRWLLREPATASRVADAHSCAAAAPSVGAGPVALCGPFAGLTRRAGGRVREA